MPGFQWPIQPQVCSGEACSIGKASAQPQAVQRWQQVHPAAPERPPGPATGAMRSSTWTWQRLSCPPT